MNDVKIIRQEIAPGRRILVTSDIHGHLNHLEKVLGMAGFCDDDLLIIVGDVIEKGPDSLKTLRYVMQLCEAGNVIVLAGNVDLWRVQMIENINESNAVDFYNYLVSQRKWKGTSILDEMATGCGFGINSAADVLSSKNIILEHFKPELDFLRSRPTLLKTQNYIFVHGGMPHKSLEDIESLNMCSFLKYDNFMSTDICFDKFVVVGHWPVTLYSNKIPQSNPVINREKKIISIDGGCGLKIDGQLNLIEIPDIFCDVGEIRLYSYDELPVCIASEEQKCSDDSINIIWTDNMINELYAENDCTYIEHISTGRKLWIPSDFIYAEHRCGDCTDYVLPVKKGDMLKIVKTTSRGYMVKKDGVTGWYYGGIEKIKSHKSIEVHVNSYLEFMNAILLTSKYNEITKPFIGYGLMTEDKNEYTDAVKKYLIPYKDEPIYRVVEEMIPNGFTFSRPVELMLSLGNSNDFTMIFQPSELCVQYCGGMKQIENLLMMLREFEKKTAFFAFFDSIKDFYTPVIEKVSLTLSSYPFIDIIEEQFGMHQNSYNYILSSLMVGNFGIEFHRKESMSSDLFSVFATDNFSLSPGILFHEYSHSFINPLTDKYFNDVLKYSDVYTKLEKYKLPDYQSGYGDFKECVNEHFVRAMAIHMLKKISCSREADMLLHNDLHCGYKFIPEILKAYDYYDANRNTFRNFECFYPELLKVFDQKIEMS